VYDKKSSNFVFMSSYNDNLRMHAGSEISVLSVELKRDDGFHLDLEDYLMGLLQLASELVSH